MNSDNNVIELKVKINRNTKKIIINIMNEESPKFNGFEIPSWGATGHASGRGLKV